MESENKSSGPQYSLKWTPHTNNIIQMFVEHLMNESLVDVTLSCEGSFLKTHRMILSACSPYFKELFQMHSTQNPVIILNGMKFSHLKQVIEFMYFGEVKVFDSDLDDFLTLAKNLQVKGLCDIRGRTGFPQNKTSQEAEVLGEAVLPVTKRRRLSAGGDENKVASVESSSGPMISVKKEFRDKISPPAVLQEDKEKRNAACTLMSFSSEPGTQIGQNAIAVLDEEITENSQTSSDLLSSISETVSENSKVNSNLSNVEEKDASKIPRPPNAFMIFANEWRKRLTEESPTKTNKEISIRLGTMWKNLPQADKEFYYSAAKKMYEEHKMKYPSYQYNPKDVRIRKDKIPNAQKTNLKSVETLKVVKFVMPDGSNRSGSYIKINDKIIEQNGTSKDTADKSTATSYSVHKTV